MISEDDLEAFGYYEMFPDVSPKGREQSVMDMVKEYQKTSGQGPNPILYETLASEEFWEWVDEVSLPEAPHKNKVLMDYSPEKELKELSDLVYVIYGYANARGWDLDKAVAKVHTSNMGRMFWPDGKIHRNSAGKILKNPDADPCDLSDLV